MIALLVLVVLNITLLGFLWYTNRHHIGWSPDRQPADPNSQTFREFDFNKEQERAFRKLSSEHRKSMRPKFLQMSELRFELFSHSEHLNDVERDRLLTELSYIQKTADSLTYVHFKRLYELSNPDQKHKLDTFIHQMVHRDRRAIPRPR